MGLTGDRRRVDMRLKQKLCCRAGHETWGVGFGGSEGEVKIYS